MTKLGGFYIQEGTLAGLKTTKPPSFACSSSPCQVSLSKDLPFHFMWFHDVWFQVIVNIFSCYSGINMSNFLTIKSGEINTKHLCAYPADLMVSNSTPILQTRQRTDWTITYNPGTVL